MLTGGVKRFPQWVQHESESSKECNEGEDACVEQLLVVQDVGQLAKHKPTRMRFFQKSDQGHGNQCQASDPSSHQKYLQRSSWMKGEAPLAEAETGFGHSMEDDNTSPIPTFA